MKILIGAILAVLTAAAQPAAAAQWRNFGGAHFNVQAQRQRSGGFQRQQPQREFRQPERDYRNPERRPDGRLTDEERRNLHRDLDRANREIYKGR
jgi:hypothetical protein